MSKHLLPVMRNRLTGEPARHPVHGHLLQAVGQLPNGRYVWPLIGGAPDDPDDDDPDDDGDDDPDDDGQPENVKDKDGNDLGYPARTKVKDMTVEQQAAYWRHHARTKEDQLRRIGDVDSLKEKAANWDKHQEDNATDLEKAKAAGKAEATTEANTKAVNAVLRVGLGARDLEDDEVNRIVGVINPSAFIDANGEVDTDKLQDYIDQVAGPARGSDDDEDEERPGRRNKKWPDTGNGRRRTKKSSGVAAGADLYKEERGSRKSTTS